MSGFSAVDGFVGISESLATMIKCMANEPSVGLFYIQQHTQKAVPNLINLGDKIGVRSRETTLQTEDLEDSITTVKSMKEYGFPIADEMIKDINRSLVVMSKKQAERLSRIGKTSPRGNAVCNLPDEGSTSYFSSIFKSVKQKTSNIDWPQAGMGKSIQEEVSPSFLNETAAVTEAHGLQLPRPVAEEKKEPQGDISLQNETLTTTSEIYDEFKAEKEENLEKWLEGIDN